MAQTKPVLNSMAPNTPVTPAMPRPLSLELVEPRNQFGRTWDEELAHIEPMLAGYSDEERIAEIAHHHQLFKHFSKPLPQAQRRQNLLASVYEATRPPLRRRFLDSIRKNWT